MAEGFADFGRLVFSEQEMENRLPRPVYLAWKKTVANEEMLDRPTADAIAHAMKTWAIERGATHYTHWFQPMTGATAEKHDAFIEPDDHGIPFTHFSGKTLIKGEPDASSFPSGGLRATFEARGYTYWDVTSPVFIHDNVLCIPTVFVSYTGEALGKKGPLLKSVQCVSKAATRTLNLLGDKDVRSCMPMVGLEQEYFLIDQSDYEAREDLKFTGRTLFGAPAPKGQELNDHYFGSISPRVQAFMKEVNEELWQVGIYAKTEHNEVAPGQYELACVFRNVNIAIDQNQIVMDTLKKTAAKHGLACLLHEKPFAGINGSGKHNNYSLVTDTGINVFSPGDKPAENIRFLVFICAFIKAADTYPELLRFSASNTGNDSRLGATEAPPAIISVFLGSYIENILFGLLKKNGTAQQDQAVPNNFTPISGLSYIPHDNTDRNRTSPLAFTGNKFEFRMVGSSMSASAPNTILNAILADSLNEIADQLEGIKYLQDVRTNALQLCRAIIRKHRRVLFSGDGYSDSWEKEAARRGLPNITCFIDAIRALDDPKNIRLLTSLGIYSEKELTSRREILIEQYVNTIAIEVRTLLDMVDTQILPAMSRDWQAAGSDAGAPAYLRQRRSRLAELIDGLDQAAGTLRETAREVFRGTIDWEKGRAVHDQICPQLDRVRGFIDRYEAIAAAEFYPVPTYKTMLFRL